MKKLFTLIVLITAISSASFAQTCDTLFNLNSTMDTAILYLADTGTAAGYLSGNNVYGDLAKAEGFAAIIGDHVTSAILDFAFVTINPADSNNTVTVAVWDNSGTDIFGSPGAPGNVIDSVNVPLSQIAQAVSSPSLRGLVLVNFSGAVALTTDSFYVGVVLPTTTGDTVALFTNTFYGPDGNGWEYEYDYMANDGSNGWGSYNNDFGSYGSLGNFILAEICSSVSGVSTISDAITFSIYPNPANDQLNFQWNVNSEADVAMYDVTGNMVKTFTINGNALNTFDIHDLAAGAYVIRVNDKANNIQRSTLFTKQ